MIPLRQSSFTSISVLIRKSMNPM
uniref:Uncharacterized protein n=1 Tax=Rhizophora mucronata TaxID=61149 RepID=A0A2P2MPL6_RHIMU